MHIPARCTWGRQLAREAIQMCKWSNQKQTGPGQYGTSRPYNRALAESMTILAASLDEQQGMEHAGGSQGGYLVIHLSAQSAFLAMQGIVSMA